MVHSLRSSLVIHRLSFACLCALMVNVGGSSLFGKQINLSFGFSKTTNQGNK